MVRVNFIKTMVRTTAATETHGASPKNWKQSIPIRAPPKCPPNRPRGWAASASVKAKRNTVDPPREKRRKGPPDYPENHKANAIAADAPTADQHRSRKFKCLLLEAAFSSPGTIQFIASREWIQVNLKNQGCARFNLPFN